VDIQSIADKVWNVKSMYVQRLSLLGLGVYSSVCNVVNHAETIIQLYIFCLHYQINENQWKIYGVRCYIYRSLTRLFVNGRLEILWIVLEFVRIKFVFLHIPPEVFKGVYTQPPKQSCWVEQVHCRIARIGVITCLCLVFTN
jgi:hypothetical protein